MKLSEIIALTKAGYKKSDIDAIIESEKSHSDQTADTVNESSNENNDGSSEETAQTDKTVYETETDAETPAVNDDIDALRKLIAEQEKQIKAMQAENNARNLNGKPADTTKQVDEILSSMIY